MRVELTQEPQIAFVELAQVVYAITQHGQALETRAECETDITLGVESEIAYYSRMNLPGPGDFEPATLIGTFGEHHVDLGRRLGKREERGSKAHHQVIAFEETPQKVGINAFE